MDPRKKGLGSLTLDAPDDPSVTTDQEDPPTAEEAPPEEPPEPSREIALPGVKLPELNADPAVINAAADQIISGAVLRYQRKEREASEQLLREAGPVVRLVHHSKSFKHVIDPKTNKPFKSFIKWGAHHKIGQTHLYRMVNQGPVMEALEGRAVGELTTRQIDFLAPMLRQQGGDALCDIWDTAKEAGDTSEAGLRRAAQVLGLTVQPEDDEPPSENRSTVLRLQSSAGTFDPKLVDRVVQEQPEVALLIAKSIFERLGQQPPQL